MIKELFPLLASSKPSPVSTFFAHAAATPLTQVTLNLELIIENLRARNNMGTEADLAYQSLLQVQHLQSLIQTITNGKAAKHSRFPAKAAMEEVVIRCNQPQIGKHIKATLSISKDAWLPGQAFYFQEMMSCLLNNAFEAYGSVRSKTIAVVALQHGKKLQIFICDQGQGMSWLTHQLATRKGYTQKSQGTGLGLAFVKQTIEQHFKGKFVLSSYTEIGTVAMIQLPLKA